MSDKSYNQQLKKLSVMALPFDKYGGKFWVMVEIDGVEWVPSFEELFWIVRFISFCEEQKYPTDQGYKGWRMVAEFMADACKPGVEWEELKKKYKIPDRDNKG